MRIDIACTKRVCQGCSGLLHATLTFDASKYIMCSVDCKCKRTVSFHNFVTTCHVFLLRRHTFAQDGYFPPFLPAPPFRLAFLFLVTFCSYFFGIRVSRALCPSSPFVFTTIPLHRIVLFAVSFALRVPLSPHSPFPPPIFFSVIPLPSPSVSLAPYTVHHPPPFLTQTLLPAPLVIVVFFSTALCVLANFLCVSNFLLLLYRWTAASLLVRVFRILAIPLKLYYNCNT